MSIFKLTSTGLILSTASMLMVNAASAATIGYWRFEGSNGHAITTATSEVNNDKLAATDQSNGNVVYSNEVAAPSIYDPVTQTTYANQGSLLSKSGNVGYVETASSPLFDGGSFTIEAFVRITDAAGQPATIPGSAAYIRASGEWQLDSDNPRTRFRTEKDNNQTVKLTTTSLADAQWHHVAITYDKSVNQVTIYADGDSKTMALNGSLSTDGTTLRIGNDNWDNSGAEALNWYLDEVRYSNTVLEPSQFLRAVPEPSASALGVFMGLISLRSFGRVRRRANSA